MSHPVRTVTLVTHVFAGNAATQELTEYDFSGHSPLGASVGGHGLDAGGSIILDDATTAVITVQDQVGTVLYTATVTANTKIAPTAQAIYGPLYCTVASADGGLTVYWGIKH